MKKKLHEEYGAIVYNIRKNCRFHYENDNNNSLPKEWMSEETFSIKTLIEK